MPNPPTKDYICPKCGSVFRARNTFDQGRAGKVCPNGHWTSVGIINAYTNKAVAKNPLAKPEPQMVRKRLSGMGVGERTDQLSVALRWMLDGYEKAIATLPEESMARASVEGAFGRLPEMAREILG